MSSFEWLNGARPDAHKVQQILRRVGKFYDIAIIESIIEKAQLDSMKLTPDDYISGATVEDMLKVKKAKLQKEWARRQKEAKTHDYGEQNE